MVGIHGTTGIIPIPHHSAFRMIPYSYKKRIFSAKKVVYLAIQDSLPKMNHAHQKLEIRLKPIYD